VRCCTSSSDRRAAGKRGASPEAAICRVGGRGDRVSVEAELGAHVPAAGDVGQRAICAYAVAAGPFKKKGTYVIVFYFGGGDVRTAVALRSLGAGPFSKDTGTIVKIGGKNSISIADESGALKSFKLTSNTVAETVYGAMIGSKYQPHKGDKVRVTAAVVNGSKTALLVNTLVAN